MPMTGKRDYYEVLGVARTASDDEIKRAYRRLAKQYHPDRNPNDRQAEAKFKEVQQAYSVLKDSAKRAQYDRYGEVGVGEWGSGPQGQQVYHWGGSSVNVDDLEELFSRFGQGGGPASIFEELFGGSFARNRGARRRDAGPSRGEDQTQVIDLTFEQAARGATLSLRLAPAGRGSSESIEVKIPPGVENGQRLRLKGRVPGVRGGPPGDLYLQCNIQPHPYFTRNNADIMVEVPVSVVEATLGGSIDVPTLEGPVTMTLPPGTASGTRLRLKRRGIATGTGDRGDQLVTIKIQPPQNLTDAQRRLFESLRESGLPEVRASVPWARAKTR